MQFKTRYDPHDRIHAEPGSGVKQLYAPRFDDDGHMELVEAGTEDLYGFIQSYKDSCDINVILERFAEGDVHALNRRQAMYADFTQFPSTYAEALNSIAAAEDFFNGLPVETRAQFGHSFNQFLAAMDKPDFPNRMGWRSADPKDEQQPTAPAPQDPVAPPSGSGSAQPAQPPLNN